MVIYIAFGQEERGMMMLFLPACFAAGFCLGYFRPGAERFRASPQLIPLTIVIGTIVIGIAAFLALFLARSPLAFAGVFLARSPQTVSGWLLAFAGVVVGVLAGVWYTNDREDKRDRDKLIFLAGAGGFLFLSALEYDHKLLGNLAKIGGGGVSVEFSDKGRNSDARPLIAASQKYLGKVFPGNSGVILSISSLEDLPESFKLDELYSILFSGNSIYDYSL
jgi:hypothetical protein